MVSLQTKSTKTHRVGFVFAVLQRQFLVRVATDFNKRAQWLIGICHKEIWVKASHHIFLLIPLVTIRTERLVRLVLKTEQKQNKYM